VQAIYSECHRGNFNVKLAPRFIFHPHHLLGEGGKEDAGMVGFMIRRHFCYAR